MGLDIWENFLPRIRYKRQILIQISYSDYKLSWMVLPSIATVNSVASLIASCSGNESITTNYNSVKIFGEGVVGSKQGGSVFNPLLLWLNLETAWRLSRDNFPTSLSQNKGPVRVSQGEMFLWLSNLGKCCVLFPFLEIHTYERLTEILQKVR